MLEVLEGKELLFKYVQGSKGMFAFNCCVNKGLSPPDLEGKERQSAEGTVGRTWHQPIIGLAPGLASSFSISNSVPGT